MFKFILLNCIHTFKGERTISGIYNLIQGKRSSQTLQDARIYQLDRYFGIYPSLKKEKLEKAIDELVTEENVRLNSEQYPEILIAGEKYLSNSYILDNNYFAGMEYHRNIFIFEKRLRLLVQTITQSHMKDFSFIPIEDDVTIQLWVKKVYRQQDASKLIDSLYLELSQLLESICTKEAELFVGRLTGGGLIGGTREQLALHHKLNKENVDLMITHTLFYIFHSVKKDLNAYPVLAYCLEGLAQGELITSSAKQTYQWFNRGYTLQQISYKRNLKMSTIQDHIVEISLVMPSFSIDLFISDIAQEEIMNTIEHLETKKLKRLFEALDGKFNYFQLRLVLTRSNFIRKGGEDYVQTSSS
ncbi:helix-turn-helix domain-containing protein [Halobacillus seohaensis]|uniref:Helix-turn-helix domain-containing protein n=1 Tax=Halobacillus seohaensis TaxID=447421 RepID=A0ABW2EGY3_9BACI